MTFRRRIVLFALGWALVSVMIGVIVGLVGERSLAKTREELRQAEIAKRLTEIAAMWNNDVDDLHARLEALVSVLKSGDVRGYLAMRRGSAISVHNSVRREMQLRGYMLPEDSSGVFYVVRSDDSTLVAADLSTRVGRRDSAVAAVVDGLTCSPGPVLPPVISPDWDESIWTSCRPEDVDPGVVAIVGRSLAQLEVVNGLGNGEALWLHGGAESGTREQLLVKSQRDATREVSAVVRHHVADVRRLERAMGVSTKRGGLFVELREPIVAMESPWKAAVVAVSASLLTAAILGLYVAGWIARPMENMAHDATIVSLRPGGIRRSFRSRGGGPELKRLAAALNTMLDRLMKTVRIELNQTRRQGKQEGKEEMALYVSHDMGNRLFVLERTLSRLGRLKNPSELASEYQEHSTSLMDCIEQLKEVARLCAHQHKSVGATRTPTNMSEAIRKEVALRQPIAGRGLSAFLSPTDVWAKMDEVNLRRVVANLLDNALVAVKEASGSVRVRCEEVHMPETDATSRCRLIIEDDGPGFPTDVRRRVFGGRRTTGNKGNGLGLKIVRHLVQSVGGYIILEASPRTGTRMVVELERAEVGSTGNTKGVKGHGATT